MPRKPSAKNKSMTPLQEAGPVFYKMLKVIATGHNDPQQLAKETIEGYTDEE